MQILRRAGVVSLWVLLVLVAAIATAAIKQRFADGPNRVFSGGALYLGIYIAVQSQIGSLLIRSQPSNCNCLSRSSPGVYGLHPLMARFMYGLAI